VAFLTVWLGQALAATEDFLPSNILMMDSKFSHHILVVEKSTHKLHLYENDGTFPKLVKTFSTATGKFKGDKTTNGDHKTPEGIYTIYEFLSKDELLRRHGSYAEIYGNGAFPMDYPNFIDSRSGKSGGGIWLHSTDDDNRISKGLDSRGCVVVQNADLKELSKYIELKNTPIIVVQDIFYLSKSTWERNRKDMATEEYAVVHLQQNYQSSIINDIGKKTLYLKKNHQYDWKIIGELWTKAGIDNLAFTPSMRFFKE